MHERHRWQNRRKKYEKKRKIHEKRAQDSDTPTKMLTNANILVIVRVRLDLST